MSRPFPARERFWMSMSLALGGLLLFGGRNLPEVSARETGGTGLFHELKVFTDVLALVRRDYVTEVDNKKLVEGAVKGMLTALDPHSGYLDPDFYQDLLAQTKGEFGGLGIEITVKDGLLVVVAPMEGSPAEKSGLRAGDAIVKIEGEFTKEFSLFDAVKKLRGPRGSPIHLSVMRKGAADLLDVTVVRDNIQVKSVRSRYLGEGFGYVRVNQFVDRTADDLAAAIKRLAGAARAEKSRPATAASPVRGLVLDLRNNPGGLLTQAIRVSDMFLRDGVIVYTDGRVESQKQKFYASAKGTEPDYPLVVLVNGGSASASEIVAGALKDHGRALVVGQQTFGKGSVQTITPLENNGALTLTTALYYTKSGRSLQALGVQPDVEVEPDPVTQAAAVEAAAEAAEPRQPVRERDLPGAIRNPDSKVDDRRSPLRRMNRTPLAPESAPADVEKDPVPELVSKDGQLRKALELLKSFSRLGV